jgi:phospholipid/cholesterol/gamma-HCH transport system ATP-binding protein
MSEEKDDAQQKREQEMVDAGHSDGGTAEDVRGIVPQIQATPGLPERKAVGRRQARVREILHTLPEPAQRAIEESFLEEERAQETGREAARKTQKVGAGSGTASTSSASSSYDDSSYQGSDAQTEQFPAYRAGDKAH